MLPRNKIIIVCQDIVFLFHCDIIVSDHQNAEGSKNMKSKFLIVLTVIMMLSAFSGCYHKTIKYTDISDNSRISDIPEIRDKEFFKILPTELENKEVRDYYFNWELGAIGSASVEYRFSIKYAFDDYKNEIKRITDYRYIQNGKKLVFDNKSFSLPAYVADLGYYNTNAYILTDDDECIVHYIYLSLFEKDDLTINKNYLPKGYTDSGDTVGSSYSIFWDD